MVGVRWSSPSGGLTFGNQNEYMCAKDVQVEEESTVFEAGTFYEHMAVEDLLTTNWNQHFCCILTENIGSFLEE